MPDFLLGIIGILITIITFLLGRKGVRKIIAEFKKQKTVESFTENLEINIVRISTKPCIDNGMGGLISSCYVDFEVSNLHTDDNEISAFLKVEDSREILASFKNKILPALKTTAYQLEFDPKKFDSDKILNKYRKKTLVLTIKDIRGNKINKKFVFKDL